MKTPMILEKYAMRAGIRETARSIGTLDNTRLRINVESHAPRTEWGAQIAGGIANIIRDGGEGPIVHYCAAEGVNKIVVLEDLRVPNAQMSIVSNESDRDLYGIPNLSVGDGVLSFNTGWWGSRFERHEEETIVRHELYHLYLRAGFPGFHREMSEFQKSFIGVNPFAYSLFANRFGHYYLHVAQMLIEGEDAVLADIAFNLRIDAENKFNFMERLEDKSIGLYLVAYLLESVFPFQALSSTTMIAQEKLDNIRNAAAAASKSRIFDIALKYSWILKERLLASDGDLRMTGIYPILEDFFCNDPLRNMCDEIDSI